MKMLKLRQIIKEEIIKEYETGFPRSAEYLRNTKKADKWFNSLSINQMKAYTKKHPFYKNLDFSLASKMGNFELDIYKYFVLKDKDWKNIKKDYEEKGDK